MWLTLSLITAVLWGIGNVILKKGLGSLPTRVVYFGNAGAFGILWLLYLTIFGGFNWQWLAMMLGVIPAAGFIYNLMALSRCDASLMNSIGLINPVVTAILAVSFLEERLTQVQGILIILVVLGAIVMSWPKKLELGKNRSWIWWGLGLGLISGTINFVSKFGVEKVGPMSYSLLIGFWQILIAIIWLKKDRAFRQLSVLVTKANGRMLMLGTGILNLGSVAFFLALGVGKVSLVMPVVNFYVVVVVVLAAWWLKERMTRQQKIGTAIILGSVIGLSILS